MKNLLCKFGFHQRRWRIEQGRADLFNPMIDPLQSLFDHLVWYCKRCGKIFSRELMLPDHPNCRCSFLPVETVFVPMKSMGRLKMEGGVPNIKGLIRDPDGSNRRVMEGPGITEILCFEDEETEGEI